MVVWAVVPILRAGSVFVEADPPESTVRRTAMLAMSVLSVGAQSAEIQNCCRGCEAESDAVLMFPALHAQRRRSQASLGPHWGKARGGHRHPPGSEKSPDRFAIGVVLDEKAVGIAPNSRRSDFPWILPAGFPLIGGSLGR